MAALVEVVNESLSVTETDPYARGRTQVIDEALSIAEATQGSRLRRQIVDEDLSISESVFFPEEIWNIVTDSGKPSGRIRYVAIEELTSDASDKKMFFEQVAFGAVLFVDSVRLEVVASATVGTRSYVIQVLQDAEVLRHLAVGTKTAGQSGTFDPNIGEGLRLLPGQSLRFADENATDPGGDTVKVKLRGRIER
jgi:hypothetical protein